MAIFRHKKAQACTNTRRSKIDQAVEETEVRKQKWRQKAELVGINHPQPKYRSNKQLTNVQNQNKLLQKAIAVTSERQVALTRHILLKELLKQSQGNHS